MRLEGGGRVDGQVEGILMLQDREGSRVRTARERDGGDFPVFHRVRDALVDLVPVRAGHADETEYYSAGNRKR